MDTNHHLTQEIMKPIEEIAVENTTKPCSTSKPSFERKIKPHKESSVINCPRCNSTNTKFCYYNNYSLTQPRYFCKNCRRYWTEGGSLRNVPVGGGSRKKNKTSRSLLSSSSINSSYSNSMPNKLQIPDLVVVPNASTQLISQNPSRMHHDQHGSVQDLNLGFGFGFSELIQPPNLELLTGITTRGMMNSFMPIPIPDHPNSVYSSSQPTMIPVISSLDFSLDGNGIHEGSSGRLLFPFEDLKTSTITKTTHDGDGHHINVEQNRDHNGDHANGYWSGMLGGGSW